MSDLHLAAYEGDSERVGRCLRAGMDVNARDEYNYTPLHRAVDMGMAPGDRGNIVAMLIRAGADVDSIDGLGRSVLELASLALNEDIIRQLMCAGGR